MLVTDDLSFNSEDSPNIIVYTFVIVQVLFLVQHWLFTAQYLKVALIFELAFSVKTGEVRKKREKR